MDGWMEWTILPGTAEQQLDHPEQLRPIRVSVPRGTGALLASRILNGASDLMSLVSEAWGVDTNPVLRARTFDAEGNEIETGKGAESGP